jgi:hypothetical protein
MRKSFNPNFMARVALAAIKGDMTTTELSSKQEVFTERLWRTVKSEEVYIKGYQIPADAQAGLGEYYPFYNDRCYHQALPLMKDIMGLMIGIRPCSTDISLVA